MEIIVHTLPERFLENMRVVRGFNLKHFGYVRENDNYKVHVSGEVESINSLTQKLSFRDGRLFLN